MNQQFQQQTLPSIKEGFAGYGGFNSLQGNAIATAQSNLNTNLTGARSQLAYQDQQLGASLSESAANRQMQGVGLAQQLYQAPLQNSLLAQQALLPYQTNLANQSQSSYDQFLRTSPENSPWTSLGLSFINQQQQAAYNPQQQGGLGGALGGMLGGGLLGQSLLGYGTAANPLGFLGASAGLFGLL